MEGRIPFSFTNFITNQELSGPFYISPDIFHTQITEYSLLTFHEWALSSFLSSSKTFLIVIMLDLSNFLVTSKRIGALWITSPVLFQLRRFLIYSGNQFVQDPLCVIALQNWCLICWGLLLSGSRSVLGNASNRSNLLRLTIRFSLGTWFQATERLVRSLPGWTSSSRLEKESVNMDRDWQGFNNHQILYILNILAIFKASVYLKILLGHRLVGNCPWENRGLASYKCQWMTKWTRLHHNPLQVYSRPCCTVLHPLSCMQSNKSAVRTLFLVPSKPLR